MGRGVGGGGVAGGGVRGADEGRSGGFVEPASRHPARQLSGAQSIGGVGGAGERGEERETYATLSAL